MLNAQLYNCQCALPMSLSIRVTTHPEIFSCVSVREYQRVWALCVCWSVRDYNSLKSIQWNSTNTHGFALAHTAYRIQTHIHTYTRVQNYYYFFILVRFIFCFVYIFVSISHRSLSNFSWMLVRSFFHSEYNTHSRNRFCVWIYILTADASPTELNSPPENRTEQNRTDLCEHWAIWEIDDKTECKINGARLLAFEDGKRNSNTNEIERVNR